MTLQKLYAFLWKDTMQARSYRLTFIAQFFTLFVPLVGLFFLKRVFDSVEIGAIQRYGGNYVEFLLVGAIIVSYSGTALRAFTGQLRSAQVTGTLEILLLTPTSLPTMMFGWALYPFIRATIMLLVYLFASLLVVGLAFSNANFAAAFIIVILMVVVMGSFGLMAASFTLAFKQGDPFTAFFFLGASLLSGAVYPVSVLPGWLQSFSNVFPQTHAIEGMRLTMIRGYEISDVMLQIGVLAIYVAILLPLSLTAFRMAMHKAKVDGSLAHY